MRERTATGELCSFITSLQFTDIPAGVVDHAKLLLLDGFACALLAFDFDWSQRAIRTVMSVDGSGPCVVWGSAHTVPASTAALLNGTLVQGLELDDYHPTGPLHSEACVLPAVFALSEHLGGVTGDRFLTAVVAGFEVGPRVGIASGGLRLVESGFHCGSIYGSVAAAAGSGRVLGLTEDECNDALGIGATQAAGLMGAQFGSMVKRMHSGRAAQSGVYAAMLARAGYTGIKDVFDIEYGGFAAFSNGEPLDLSVLTHRLGDDWEASRIAIKPLYACMAGLHSSLDAIRDLRDAGYEIPANDVVSIDLGVSTAMFRHAGWMYDPDGGIVAAQMNLQYAVARMIADFEFFVPQLTPAKVAASDIMPLIRRIRPYADPEIDAQGTEARWAVRMTIRLQGRPPLFSEVMFPRGSPQRPLTPVEVVDKYYRMALTVVDRTHAERLKATIESLENLPDVSVLSSFLGFPKPLRQRKALRN